PEHVTAGEIVAELRGQFQRRGGGDGAGETAGGVEAAADRRVEGDARRQADAACDGHLASVAVLVQGGRQAEAEVRGRAVRDGFIRREQAHAGVGRGARGDLAAAERGLDAKARGRQRLVLCR